MLARCLVAAFLGGVLMVNVKRWQAAVAGLLVAAGTGLLTAHPAAAPEEGRLKVTVNYKGPGKMEIRGYAGRDEALATVEQAIADYAAAHSASR